MSSLLETTRKLTQFALRSWSRGRLPCAERLRRYLGRMRFARAERQAERARTAALPPRVPRIVDDEWPPWSRGNDDPAHRRRPN